MSDRPTPAHWQPNPAPARYAPPVRPVAALPRIQAGDVQAHLRECGVVVHHAARMPTPRDGRQIIVVFLEDTPEQIELGRRSAKRLPGVLDVAFSGYNRAMMYVIASPAHADQVIAANSEPDHSMSAPAWHRPGSAG